MGWFKKKTMELVTQEEIDSLGVTAKGQALISAYQKDPYSYEDGLARQLIGTIANPVVSRFYIECFIKSGHLARDPEYVRKVN